MPPKSHIDLFGVMSLVGFAALMAFNQVVVKVVNDGLQPVFVAGLRSAGATLCVAGWMILRGIPIRVRRDRLRGGLLIGAFFGLEFIALFVALDLTTVARSAVMLYSMPVWFAVMAHFLLPGQRITWVKAMGLALAFAGVAWAILSRGAGAAGSLTGDLCALAAAIGWAGIGIVARSPLLRDERPEMQLLWQVAVSTPILLGAAFLFGPFIRDLAPIHVWGLAFQTVVVVSFGFMFWLWLMSVYPPAGVASFSFLSPVFAVIMGWALLREQIGWSILLALALVAGGLILVNLPARVHQVPQKV